MERTRGNTTYRSVETTRRPMYFPPGEASTSAWPPYTVENSPWSKCARTEKRSEKKQGTLGWTNVKRPNEGHQNTRAEVKAGIQ